MADDAEMAQMIADALDNPVLAPFMLMQVDILRREVAYDFDAQSFYSEHVGLVFDGTPESDEAAGKSLRAAIAATNHLAGGGAAGYLALISVLMVAFRGDYYHAYEMVRHYVLDRA